MAFGIPSPNSFSTRPWPLPPADAREYEIPWDQRNKPEFEIPYYKYGKRQHRFLSRQTADLLLGDL